MNRIHKVLLVNVGTDHEISAIANDGTFPALGVVSLATVLRGDHPHVEVVAVDGQIVDQTDIERSIRNFAPDLLGLSVLGTSYRSALRLAAVGKDTGATIILGNDHAAVMASRILSRREFVDYICTADVGEFALSAFVSFLEGKRPIQSVPGLVYRTPNGICQNHLSEIPIRSRNGGGALVNYVLDEIPVPDRTLMRAESWDRYLHNYIDRYGSLHRGETVTGVCTINRARGCARRKTPCNFCGISDLSLRFSSPEMFWADVKAAQNQVSASIFYEAFDSMSSSPRWVEQLVQAKPKHTGDARFFVYTQAAETTPRLVELYRRLGVYRVNMGLESGDTRMLRILKGARDSLDTNRRACLMFKGADMPIYGSLVLGGAGETHESLTRTIDFARWLIDNQMMAALEVQPLYPDFAAVTGNWIMNPDLARAEASRLNFTILDQRLLDSMPHKYASTDLVDFEEISIEWNKIFSHVTWDDLIEATAIIRSYATERGVVSGSARMSRSPAVEAIKIDR